MKIFIIIFLFVLLLVPLYFAYIFRYELKYFEGLTSSDPTTPAASITLPPPFPFYPMTKFSDYKFYTDSGIDFYNVPVEDPDYQTKLYYFLNCEIIFITYLSQNINNIINRNIQNVKLDSNCNIVFNDVNNEVRCIKLRLMLLSIVLNNTMVYSMYRYNNNMGNIDLGENFVQWFMKIYKYLDPILRNPIPGLNANCKSINVYDVLVQPDDVNTRILNPRSNQNKPTTFNLDALKNYMNSINYESYMNNIK